MSLFYTVASLPDFLFGDPPPLSVEELYAQCEGMLSDADLGELQAVVEGRLEDARSPFARRWRNADAQLRNAVARARGERIREDAGAFLRPHEGFDVSIEKAVEEAFAKANPLDRQTELDRCRWRLLEDLGREDPYGLGDLLAYALRLRIARRRAASEPEPGRERFNELLHDYVKDAGLTFAAPLG